MCEGKEIVCSQRSPMLTSYPFAGLQEQRAATFQLSATDLGSKIHKIRVAVFVCSHQLKGTCAAPSFAPPLPHILASVSSRGQNNLPGLITCVRGACVRVWWVTMLREDLEIQPECCSRACHMP